MTSLALGFLFVGAATSRARGTKSAITQLAKTSDTSLVHPVAQAVARSRQDSFPLRGRAGTSGNGLVSVIVC